MKEKSITPEGIISQAMGLEMSFSGAEFPASTICYAHLQASGFINGHLMDCVYRKEGK